MPRDVLGNYGKPYLDVVTETVIESVEYNGTINDISADLNAARPVVAGGTGGTSPVTARKGIGAEAGGVLVTNYDTHVFEPGSFYSTPGADGEPVASHNFAGVCYGINDAVTPGNTKLVLEARDLNEVPVPGSVWIRTKVGTAAWSAWSNEIIGSGLTVGDDVSVGGEVTATGSVKSLNGLEVEGAAPSFNIGRIGVTNPMAIRGIQVSGGAGAGQRWQMDLGNHAPETGGNAGTNFVLNRFADNGAFLGIPLEINRATGNATFSAGAGFGSVAPGSSPGFANTVVGAEVGASGYLACNRAGGGTGFFGMNSDGVLVYWNRSGATVGSITVNSTTTAYNTSSDERLKEDLRSFDAAASAIVEATNVYDFRWKKTGERTYGVVAQEAEAIYPAAVTHDEKNDWWGIDYSKYVPVILQELKALRARVAELEGRLDAKPS